MEDRAPTGLLHEVRQHAASSWIDVREFLRTRREILRNPRSALLPSTALGMSPFRFAAAINLVLPAALGAVLVMVLTFLAPPPPSLNSLRSSAYAQLRSEASALLPADRSTLRRMTMVEAADMLGGDALWFGLQFANEDEIHELQRQASSELASLGPRLNDSDTLSAVARLDQFLALEADRARFDGRMVESGVMRVLDLLLGGFLILLNAIVFRVLVLRKPGLFAHAQQSDRVLLYVTTAILAPLCLVLQLSGLLVEGLWLYHVSFRMSLMLGAMFVLGGAIVIAYLGCAGPVSALLAGVDAIEPALRARTRRCMVASMLVTALCFLILVLGLVLTMDWIGGWMFPG